MVGRPSRFVVSLSDEDREVLEHLREHGDTSRVRHRAHAILLSETGKSVNELAAIFGVRRNTISAWLDRWNADGLTGLGDADRSGAPPKLSEAETQQLIDLLKENPHSPRDVLAEFLKATGKTLSRSTLRRLARRFNLRWKRTRKSLKSKRDQKEFDKAAKELEGLKEQHRSGDLHLYYFDEAGFSLVPPVRYGWQPTGETIEVPSARSKQLNVLGFLSLGSQLTPYTVEGTIDTDIVIACFDNFCETLDQPTVVVIDNASPHSSKKFADRIPEWEQQGLSLYFLPPYCPELNLIEILWQRIKYQWLPLEAYDTFKSLFDNVSDVLSKVGTSFTLNFSAELK